MWAAYRGIVNIPVQPPYRHLTVNHSTNFVDRVANFVLTALKEATRLLTNWRKQMPLRKSSSEEPSPIPRPTGPERPWCTTNFSWKADCTANSNRVDAVLLSRLRLGHMSRLKACAHLLYPAAGPTCPMCKGEPQTLQHWQQRCPNLEVLRQRTFGSPSSRLGVLTTDPERVLALVGDAF